VTHGGLVYVSGLLGFDGEQSEPDLAPVEIQAERCLANLAAVLAAAGTDRMRVLKVTVYIDDIAAWPSVNAIYSRFFGTHRPARCIVPVNRLHHGFSIELDAVAAVG
jgi:2-iminobutanoate/2-iminopropanoate deaminase